MAHYAYKECLYDIDYQKYLQLVEQFEAVSKRECDCDSNYNGDNWLIAAMWINELRAENQRLKDLLRHDFPNRTYRIRVSLGDHHYQQIIPVEERMFVRALVENMIQELHKADVAAIKGVE